MVRDIKELYGSKLVALDGAIGHIKDFYFDDMTWVVRYLVANTGSWLIGQLVLLTPHVLKKFDPARKTLPVNLHRKQIQNSPSIELHKPVSRQYEIEYYRYYGWPAYWNGQALWGASSHPVISPPSEDELEAQFQYCHREDKHLQSTKAVTGYAIQALDGPIGHVSGFRVDEKSWAVLKLVIDIGNWYVGKEILISPTEVERISYKEFKVFVHRTKAELRQTEGDEVVKSAPVAISER